MAEGDHRYYNQHYLVLQPSSHSDVPPALGTADTRTAPIPEREEAASSDPMNQHETAARFRAIQEYTQNQIVYPCLESGTWRGLLESSTRLKPHEAQSYRKKALWVSWVSIIVTLALAVAAFTVSVMRYSASSFGFAFDATLDVLSSVIVLWRYSNAAAVHSAHREYIACVILGVIFLLSSICIVIKAIHDLAKKVLPEVGDFLYSVSVLSGILCTILAVIKFMLGKVLTSRALITDGFNSLVGGIMGFSILLSAEVFKHNSSVWYLDGSIGVLIGLTIFAYGIKLLIDMIPRVRQTRHYEMFE
nr:PREDICTED: transmembrane protein 163 [Struthio camelus australis]